MSRLKRVVAGSVLAAALIAVPVVPAFAHQSAPSSKAVVATVAAVWCGDCWTA